LESVRTFVGVDFPETLKRHLAGLQQRLALPGSTNGLLWTPRRNFHLTLFYLGTTPVPLLGPLAAALAEAARACTAFPLVFGGLNCFPASGVPRVLFLETQDPTSGLQRLHGRICEALAQFDFHPDHDVFRPHVTLCRAGRRASPPRLRALREQAARAPDDRPEPLTVDEAVFFRSVPERDAAVYQSLQRLPLTLPAPDPTAARQPVQPPPSRDSA
jgi:2'-5' RNA ligase